MFRRVIQRNSENKKKQVDTTVSLEKQIENKIDSYLQIRDYPSLFVYVKSLLDGKKVSGAVWKMWMAYAKCHNGEAVFAYKIYRELIKDPVASKEYLELSAYSAICLYIQNDLEKAVRQANDSIDTPLKVRLLLHLAQRTNRKDDMKTMISLITKSVIDNLSLAALYYHNGNFKKALDIYHQVIKKHANYKALNIYIAMCYFQMDMYDQSLNALDNNSAEELSSVYIAIKASNIFMLENGKAAIKKLEDFAKDATDAVREYSLDVFEHNKVVFSNGERALSVLPHILEAIPEARWNLAIYYVNNSDPSNALKVIDSREPSISREHLIMFDILLMLSRNEPGNYTKYMNEAENILRKMLNDADGQNDTIIHRLAAASYNFLKKDWKTTLKYLLSIEEFYKDSDIFLFNLAQVYMTLKNFEKATATLLDIKHESILLTGEYSALLARCLIQIRRPLEAWEFYSHLQTSDDAYICMQQIATDCYKKGFFFYAAKGFDILERVNGIDENKKAKVGACIGAFQLILGDKLTSNAMPEILEIMESCANDAQYEKHFLFTDEESN
ncbi:hypothetical protein SNEBB_003462 [Seison nebaliae]|nr:hypothetical protein SNEBB_003462 [Seison nebaliae]